MMRKYCRTNLCVLTFLFVNFIQELPGYRYFLPAVVYFYKSSKFLKQQTKIYFKISPNNNLIFHVLLSSTYSQFRRTNKSAHYKQQHFFQMRIIDFSKNILCSLKKVSHQKTTETFDSHFVLAENIEQCMPRGVTRNREIILHSMCK